MNSLFYSWLAADNHILAMVQCFWTWYRFWGWCGKRIGPLSDFQPCKPMRVLSTSYTLWYFFQHAYPLELWGQHTHTGCGTLVPCRLFQSNMMHAELFWNLLKRVCNVFHKDTTLCEMPIPAHVWRDKMPLPQKNPMKHVEETSGPSVQSLSIHFSFVFHYARL